MTTTPRPILTDAAPVAAALHELRTAERDAVEAKRAIALAKDAIAVALCTVAAPYRSGELELPVDRLHSLYWDEPALRVRDIARAFGLPLRTLTGLIGPGTETVACRSCGAATERVRRSRSDERASWCEECEHPHAVPGVPGPRWDDPSGEEAPGRPGRSTHATAATSGWLGPSVAPPR
jgi:hypothetical protein